MSNLRSDQIIKGSHLMVFMEVVEQGISTLKPIAFATSHTFSKQLNTQEISCKDYGDAAAVVPQNYTWTCQTDNLYSVDGYKQVNDVFKEMKPITVYFGETTYNNAHQDSIVDSALPNWEMSGFGEKGKAYITALDVTASAGENATFSATFTGTGTLENAGPTPGPTPTPGDYDITYTFDQSLTDSEYGHGTLSTSATSADAGDTVTITRQNIAETDVYIESNDATLISDTNGWTFEMPASNVEVEAKRKYTMNISNYTDAFSFSYNSTLSSINGISGSNVKIYTTQENTNSYTMVSNPQLEWSTGSENNSYYFTSYMPDLYDLGSTYTYLAITPTQNQ